MIRKITMATLAIVTLGPQREYAFADTANDLLATGSYIAVDDIGRSQAFYTSLLGGEPAVTLEDFVAFDISGGWFVLVSRERYAPDSAPGAGAVPYIQSNDLSAVQTRAVKATGANPPSIIEEPGIRLLKIQDPDGHLIEFYMLTQH